MNNSLLAGAEVVIHHWLALKPDEKLLIIYDENYLPEAKALESMAEQSQAQVRLALFNKPSRNRTELSGMFDGFDAAIGVTDYSLLTTESVMRAVDDGLRYLSFPPITLDGRSVLTYDFIHEDPAWARQSGQRIIEAMHQHYNIHVTTPTGTDLHFRYQGRIPQVLTGSCQTAGSIASSSFEFFIPIEEDQTEGVLMLDGAIGQIGPLESPLKLTYSRGKIASIGDAPDGDKLRSYIDSFQDERTLAASEFGIGLNRLGKCLGRCYIEDESAYSTCHIGHGRNLTLGGELDAEGHYDLVMLKPTITAGDTVVMRDGELLV